MAGNNYNKKKNKNKERFKTNSKSITIDGSLNIQNGLKIASLNINGMSERKIKKKKFIEFNKYLEINSIDICCIQEWYVLNDHGDIIDWKNIDFPNYSIHKSNSKTMIIYKKSLKIEKLDYNIDLPGLE